MTSRARYSRKRRRPFLMAALTIVFTGCLGPVEPEEILTWEAPLIAAPGAPAELAGSVAMVASDRRTQIGIGVQGAASNARLGWAVRNGTCEGTGQRVGPATAFPAIDVSGEGNGQAETVIQRRFDEDPDYAGEVFANADGTGAVLACADLARVN